ncbi:ATP-binding protein [Lichenihabitans sp. PAMC28606]|uniref:ATP-binding protein n=1 Tax=Lichenihabitans sp. PAMC28606 TaxID=2880932 RepID=UPI001D0B8CA0|nr:ATP-binding protein [Lichenihabitans sp. PAMC28606]UDL95337.1 ATP-binding protein [Lichenihabitans sp. PAMC28606]
MRIDIDLGMTSGQGAGGPATLDLEELLATRLLVQGNSGSGKSHLLRRLLEQSAPHVQQLIVDPEGDFVGLADRFGHVVVDGNRSVSDLECIAARVRQHRVSAVLNLESLDAENQMRAAAVFLNALFDAERDYWFPMLVVVDEAQLFAPAVSGDVAEDARKASLGAMTNLMCRGRKRGLAGVIATQRLAKLAKNVAAEATNFLMGRTFLDIDMARAADLLGLERRQAEVFRELQRGHFVALGPALSRRPLSIRVGSVETQARAGTPLLTPLPGQSTEDARDLILAPVRTEPGRAVAERRVSAPPPPSMNQILEQIVRDRPPEPVEDEASLALSTEEREQACRVIAYDILADPDASFRPEAVLYQDFVVRCRIKKIGGGPMPLPEFKLHLNVARAGVDPAAVDLSEWSRAIAVARQIPDDLQASFLILAGAALLDVACPSDLEISRRCGHHSAGRARSRIGHLEKRDLVVMRTDMSGQRSAVLPDLGWETRPGDSNGPAMPQVARDAAE